MKRILCVTFLLALWGSPAVANESFATTHDVEEFETAFAPQPDLRFDPLTIRVDTGWGIVNVKNGGRVRIRCNWSTVRVGYRYKNASFVGAGGHSVRAFFTGGPSVVAPQPPLGPNAFRSNWVSLNGSLLPPNVWRQVRIYLDNFNAVAEMNEGNNLFTANVIRVCP